MMIFTLVEASSANVNIIIDNKPVVVNMYTANFQMGYSDPYQTEPGENFGIEFNIYVQTTAPYYVLRVYYKLAFGPINITNTVDMWGAQEVQSNDIMLPSYLCKDKCNISMPTVTKYAPTCAAAGECTCYNATSYVPFCTAPTWSFSTLTNFKQSDLFAQQTYEAVLAAMQAAGDVSKDAQASLMDFVCKFYVPICNSTNNILRPDMSLLTFSSDSQKDAAVNANAVFSSYLATEGKTASQPSNNDKPSDDKLAGWKIALIVIGVLAGVALIGIGIVFAYKRSMRAKYESMKP